MISADDHIVEPPDTFEGRVPAKFAERAPRVVEKDDGSQVWVYDGQELPNVGFNAVVGRPVDEYSFEPVRFDQMRRGAWDIDARIADMDINGVYASVNFPSFLPGFAGQRLQNVTNDVELAMATVRAWNDWHIDAWAGRYPDRIIPNADPVVARRRRRRRHDPRERGARLQGGHVPRVADRSRPPEHPLRLLGPVHRRVRRDRDRHQPAHRLVGRLAHHE